MDGSFGDGFVDRQDGGPPPRDLGVVDAQVVEGCARWGDPAACAADDCTFRNGQCVDWPSCDGHAVQDGQGLCEDQACQTSLDGACYDAEDPARCDDIDTHNCLFRRCFWWRAPGETARCHVDDRPADCDQPDGASCEAAGCEWTGFGCARPLDTACAALDADACAGRPDCMQTAVGCEVRPDVACAELAQDDCRGRFDCGWLGAACVDLDAEAPCAQQGDWACAERQDCEPLRADACVVAAGSYSTALLAPLGLRLPVQPVKGYSLTIPLLGWPCAPRVPVIDEHFHAAVCPLGDRLRVAGTAEFTGFDANLTPSRIANLYRLVEQVYPDGTACIDRRQVVEWCGFRPMSPDGVGLMGPSAVPGLFLNTGHGHLGWTMAPGAGKLVADQVLGVAAGIAREDYLPARFGC